ncbi:MAG: NACHT domain-containing protein, partial [Bacilli bacterium]|nr:NACHT domain-containing protein [Bacilli bacterium]
YVELSCVNEDEYGEEIELSQVFSENNVVWIKGEAGSGKTTFLQWVAVCAAKNEYHKIENIRNTIPIVVELRNTKWPISLQNAVNRITTIYGNNCPDGWILDLLKRDRIVLLFDGLDEINQMKRADVYKFVEDIVEQYPYIKVLLTARNSVKDCMNCESVDYEILPMKIENIKEFVVYWHRSVLRKDAIISDQEIDRLQFNLKKKIVGSPSLKTLARNPLLCAMICALNCVNNEQLPEGKMELYEKCCEMLMDARDNQRKIDGSIYEKLPRLDYGIKRKILEEMSYWMMNGNVSSESKANVRKYLEHLLRDTNILTDNNKEYSVQVVLDYLIDRSGIIRETEEAVIDFIHKTFMD